MKNEIRNINEGLFAGVLFFLSILLICLASGTNFLWGKLLLVFLIALIIFGFILAVKYSDNIVIGEKWLEVYSRRQSRQKYSFENLSLRLRGFQGYLGHSLKNANALCANNRPVVYNPSALLLFYINKKKKIKGSRSVYFINGFLLLCSVSLFCGALIMLIS